jgi:MalT-like TPR region
VGIQAALEEARAVRDDAVLAGDGLVADASAAFVGLVCVLADDYREAVGHLEPAAEGLLRRGDRGMASLALGWLALAAARSGDLRRAGEVAERAVATAEPLRDFHWTGSARCVLAEIRLLQGRLEEASAALAPIDRLVAGFDEPPFMVGWERTKAMLALEHGRPQDAVAWCRREGAWQPEPSEEGERLAPDTRLVLAAALRQAGDHRVAARVLHALFAVPYTRRCRASAPGCWTSWRCWPTPATPSVRSACTTRPCGSGSTTTSSWASLPAWSGWRC